MQSPTMFEPRRVAPETTCLPAYAPLPGLGVLPVNSFVIEAAEPVLVDTGLEALREPFLKALRATIDPERIRWIFMSHMDADHLGNLNAVLALAPHAKIVTTFLGMAKLELLKFDLSRVHLIEPGASIRAGDRTIVSLKPPYYDAPETVGFFDTLTRVLFSADAFGALMRQPVEDAAAIPAHELRDGLATWSALDAPWLGMIDRAAFGHALAGIEQIEPAAIISGHLPVARGMTRTLLRHVEGAVGAAKIAGPDHDSVLKLIAA